MHLRFFLGRAALCMTALSAVTALGCGGGGSICDVDFGSIAGAYSFTWKTHSARYENSCFEDYTDPGLGDPAELTDCTWEESSDDETITIELVIEENGDIGNARITSITDEDGDQEETEGGVQCELLEGELCDAPIRCTLTGQTCDYGTEEADPDEWKYYCNCEDDSPNDPEGAACQECEASFATYVSEREEYCNKSRAGDYFEFTLHVKE